jgi:hypothetical protein
MHTAKSLILLGSLLGASIVIAQASAQEQPGTAPQAQGAAPGRHYGANPDRAAKRLSRELGLTADQEARIMPIFADRQTQMQSVWSDSSLTPEDRRAKMQGISQDSNSKIEAVLNDAQKKQFEQIIQKRQERRQQQEAQPQ